MNDLQNAALTALPMRRVRLHRRILNHWQLYVLLIPTIIYFVLFRYYPMYGIQIAFKDYRAALGIVDSPWIGVQNFQYFFSAADFPRLLGNTLAVSVGTLLLSFPLPIILALLLNQLPSLRYKKIVQTTLYAPHFISTVVMVGMIFLFVSPSSGIINKLIEMMGGEAIHFMAMPQWFVPIYVISEIWQSTGWGSILYLAALAGISPELHESALVDGANKLQRIIHIDIAGIMPTVVVMLILNAGKVMNVGYDKVYLMQTSLNISASEIISTYVYKRGLLKQQFSLTTAVGLFESVVNLVLIVSMNWVSRRLTDSSLF